MIIPPCTPDGLPDYSARVDTWSAVCDRCDYRRRLGECALRGDHAWIVGHRPSGGVYCPPCVAELAAELIATAFRSGLLALLVHAARRRSPDWLIKALTLATVVALACAAALLPRALRVRVEGRARGWVR